MEPIRESCITPIVVLLLVSVGVTGSMDPVVATAEPLVPLPFDPLSDEEQARAIEAVLSDANVSAVLSDRHEVIGASLYTHKSFQHLEQWPRMAETWLYDHGSGLAVRALVDLGPGVVVQAETVPIQPPLTAAEVDLAGRMALEDEKVSEALTAAGAEVEALEWTGRLWTGDAATACPAQRCVLLAFRDGSTLLHEHRVLVDLTADRVLGVLGLDPPASRPVASSIAEGSL